MVRGRGLARETTGYKPVPQRRIGYKPLLQRGLGYKPMPRFRSGHKQLSQRIQKLTGVRYVAFNFTRCVALMPHVFFSIMRGYSTSGESMILARAVVTSGLADGRDLRESEDILGKAARKLKREIRGYEIDSSAEPDKMMPIAAYDLNAVPGHTYKYRIRYEIINHYAGNAGELRNPNDASQLTLFSDWSPASREVRVEAEKQFFLTAANPRGGQARVAIWEKNRSGFSKNEVEVVVGDKIGDTGAQCIDLIFNEDINGRQDTVMVYIAKDGSLRQSLLSVDREIDRAFKN